MKNILFYMIIAFSSLLRTEAAEKPISIPCYISNDYWPSKTKLKGTIHYSDQTQRNISLAVDGFISGNPSPQKRVDLPFGNIDTISLDLTNYKAKEDGTLLANLDFAPTSPIKMVTFRIVEKNDDEWGVLQIVPEVTYLE